MPSRPLSGAPLTVAPLTVAIVGATGAVGVEFLRCLAERRFPVKELRLLASARSVGRELSFDGKALVVQELTEKSFEASTSPCSRRAAASRSATPPSPSRPVPSWSTIPRPSGWIRRSRW